MTWHNLLVLGGTGEAAILAQALARHNIRAIVSYAGRVSKPRVPPVAYRVGGFGGAVGLCAYLQEQGITHVVDATHPFAVQISRNAAEACRRAGVPLLALSRPPWQAQPADRWISVANVAAAVAVLAAMPVQCVLLAIGRLQIAAFGAVPWHRYVVRMVEAPRQALPLPRHHLILARGPFEVAQDKTLLHTHGVQLIVCKNAGGSGAVAKLHAARALGVPVVMIERPPQAPAIPWVRQPQEVLAWLSGAW